MPTLSTVQWRPRKHRITCFGPKPSGRPLLCLTCALHRRPCTPKSLAGRKPPSSAAQKPCATKPETCSEIKYDLEKKCRWLLRTHIYVFITYYASQRTETARHLATEVCPEQRSPRCSSYTTRLLSPSAPSADRTLLHLSPGRISSSADLLHRLGPSAVAPPPHMETHSTACSSHKTPQTVREGILSPYCSRPGSSSLSRTAPPTFSLLPGPTLSFPTPVTIPRAAPCPH